MKQPIRAVHDAGCTRRAWLWAAAAPLWAGKTATLQIADIVFELRMNGSARRTYLWIHGDERTAREVLLGHLSSVKGRAILVQSSERLVVLAGGRIDPNRMFSREGAGKSLRRLNPEWSAEKITATLDALDRDRPRFLRTLLPEGGRLLVALHNNSRGYSVKDETAASDEVSLRDAGHPHEFMLCTNRQDYEQLAQADCNVVLQSRGPKDDDGSCSRLAAARSLRYVNIEAELGKPDEQRRMLEAVERLPLARR